MSVERSLRLSAVAALIATATMMAAAAPSPGAPESSGRLFVVQAVPSTTYEVWVDGEQEQAGVDTGTVLGPLELSPGEHEVRFDPDSGRSMTATVGVRTGSSVDLVLHLPADQGGAPVADIYRASSKPVASGMARVLVAHTATIPPADVRVDGKVVFADIANGEFAEADVPSGQHTAALVSAGSTSDPILGPLDVDLPAGTVTMVYAVGTPTNGSMDVISHRETVATRKSTAPRVIDTGSAGLARAWPVVTFQR